MWRNLHYDGRRVVAGVVQAKEPGMDYTCV